MMMTYSSVAAAADDDVDTKIETTDGF